MLWSSLDNAEIDAPGAGWEGFQQYQNRRKRRFVFFWMILGISLSIGITAFLLTAYWQPAPLSKSEHPLSSYPKQNTDQALPFHSQRTEKDIVIGDQKPDNNPMEKAEALAGVSVPGISPSGKTPPSESQTDLMKPLIDETVINGLTDFGHVSSLTYVEIGVLRLATLIAAHKPAPEVQSPEIADSGLTEKNSGKWHVQIQEGFVYSFPQFELQNAGSDYVHKDYPGIRKKGENGLLGLGFRFTVGREIGKFNVSAGFGITYQKVLGDYDFIYSETPLIDVDNKIFGYGNRTPVRIQFGSDQAYFFTEIPIGLEWSPFSPKQRIKKSIYLNYVNQFLMGVKGDLPNALMLDQVDQMSISNFNYYSSSFEFGFNFAYQLNQKNDLILSPRYRWNAGLDQIQGYYDTRLSYIGVHLMWRTQF